MAELTPALEERLRRMRERYDELTHQLSCPDAARDPQHFQTCAQEQARLEPVVQHYVRYLEYQAQRTSARTWWDDPDPELRVLAREDTRRLDGLLAELIPVLQAAAMPHDPRDPVPVFLEIRAGAGGDEAALFVGDLVRMHTRYAERKGWDVAWVHAHEAEQGGFKEVVLEIQGQQVYRRLKFESGVHRVQRVPATESQGRIHTSTCTVAVLPILGSQQSHKLDPRDLRIDTYRASGAGGQHVNRTESAVRVVHVPSGLVVACQDERSQHKNRAKAMALLEAKLSDKLRQEADTKAAAERKMLVGTGDRSERIRTYNVPQGRLTDHRIGLTLYQLGAVLDGDLDCVVEPLQREYQAQWMEQQGL